MQHTDINERKNIAIPIFNFMCFICKNGSSVSILVSYLQNNMGFNLTCKEGAWCSLTSKNNEQIHVWTIEDFKKTRSERYHAIFIQDDIYDYTLADKVSIHTWRVNELIPAIEPQVFKLPKESRQAKSKGY